jgi:hypothetical protein
MPMRSINRLSRKEDEEEYCSRDRAISAESKIHDTVPHAPTISGVFRHLHNLDD